MIRSTTALILALAGGSMASGASAPLADGLHRTDDGFVRVYQGERFGVDASIVSVKLADPAMSFAEFLNTLPEANAGEGQGAPLQALALIRSNRLGWHDVRLPEGADLLVVMKSLRASGLVVAVEETVHGVYTSVPNDQLFDEQWAMQNTGQTGGTAGADMNAVEAWSINPGSDEVFVAVVDSGVNYNHADLETNMWKNEGDATFNGVDDDGNGYIDDYHGWDFVDNNNDPQTSGSHGSLVAGCVAAARNNGIGIAGLAGGDGATRGCLMMPLAVGSAFPVSSAIDDAIIYGADNGARVITMSLSVGSSGAIADAVEYATNVKGCLVLCAAGNGGSSVGFPANLPLVMAIGATDHDDDPASFTNPGPQVEVAAPGVDVLTTTISGGYDEASGTSFAAPYSAALAALIWSEAPCLTNAEVRQHMIDTADDVHTGGFDNFTGWGRINAGAALAALADACCPADSNGDGVVDLGDLNEVLAHFGEGTQPPIGPDPVVPEAGDLNGDDRVDLEDLNIVLGAFGQPCGF
ncbi:MAG: S8 family serine peptidase [bacterium]|nr:S8 family serine peptidase [bacterium]